MRNLLKKLKWTVSIVSMFVVSSLSFFRGYYTEYTQQQQQQRYYHSSKEAIYSPPVNETTARNMLSPVCYPKLPTTTTNNPKPIKITRIYLKHMRKAGGSSLRKYFKKVAQLYNFTFVAAEGSDAKELFHGGHRGTGDPFPRDDTLYVSHLREPVSRAVSHFKYDQRWRCRDLFNHSFVPTAENARNFHDYVVDGANNKTCSIGGVLDNSTEILVGAAGSTKRLWSCKSSCYIRWFNFPEGKCHEGSFVTGSELYHKAIYRAKQHHVLIHVERLYEDQSYANALERYFGVPNINRKTGMTCGKESANANRLVPFEPLNSSMNELIQQNQADSNLYRELVTCPNGIHFPDQVLADIVPINPVKFTPDDIEKELRKQQRKELKLQQQQQQQLQQEQTSEEENGQPNTAENTTQNYHNPRDDDGEKEDDKGNKQETKKKKKKKETKKKRDNWIPLSTPSASSSHDADHRAESYYYTTKGKKKKKKKAKMKKGEKLRKREKNVIGGQNK